MKHICAHSRIGQPISIDYNRIVAIGECSGSNDYAGDMWLITQTFSPETPIVDIMKWAWENRVTGKLTVSVDESSKIQKHKE
ncbi:MAG TPA: hypothetical protein VMW50_13145 [Dehalococcoidia bacterium]|nr:hypothetical protein [Dehalococcoidia bacterium]